jgi:hypothetical protein
MKAVYALVSNGWDQYAQMAYLSASSLKRIHPDARTVLVTDGATADSLAPVRGKLRECFDDLHTITVPGGTIKLRSRAIKTMLRQVVTGDFIFLDADTLVVRPIDGLWSMPVDLGMTYDGGSNCHHQYIPPYTEDLYRALGWHYPPPAYVNSGVMLVRDTLQNHALFDLWRTYWQQQIAATSYLEDQGSLAHSLARLRLQPSIISSNYNSMILTSLRIPVGACVIHYFATLSCRWYDDFLVTTYLRRRVAADEPIDWELLDQSVREGHPWRTAEPWLLRRSGYWVSACTQKLANLLRLKGALLNPSAGRGIQTEV